MEYIERMARFVFRRLGLEVARSRATPYRYFPPPSAAARQEALGRFADSFAIAPNIGLSAAEIEQQLKAYRWFYPFEFNGRLVDTERKDIQEIRTRHQQRYLHIFSALLALTGGSLANYSVLDVACNAGFWSIQAQRCGAQRVLGIDASPQNIAQANLVARLIGLDRVQYQTLNVYDLDRETVGEFDIVFFFGILYHLDKPMEVLERLYALTRKFVVVDTELVPLELPMLRLQADDVRHYHTQSHANRFALIPSRGAVTMMLKSAGFSEVFMLRNSSRQLPKVYLKGKWGSFIAMK